MSQEMLLQTMSMVKLADFCPDALVKTIYHKSVKDPNFVQEMFNMYGRLSSTELAHNMIDYYKEHL